MDEFSERIDPKAVPKGILAIHQIRYRFASPYSTGLNVLDVACGAGYGSAMLAAEAKTVVGLDLDPGAVKYAARNFVQANCRFLRGSALRLPFGDRSFGLVASFETIEHLPDPSGFLAEICRVIREDGCALISTPIARATTHTPTNPHHTIEYSSRDFRLLLGSHFKEVELWGQRRVQGRLHRLLQRLDFIGLRHRIPQGVRYRIDRSLGTEPFEEMSFLSQEVVREDLARADVMLAVCRSVRQRAGA